MSGLFLQIMHGSRVTDQCFNPVYLIRKLFALRSISEANNWNSSCENRSVFPYPRAHVLMHRIGEIVFVRNYYRPPLAAVWRDRMCWMSSHEGRIFIRSHKMCSRAMRISDIFRRPIAIPSRLMSSSLHYGFSLSFSLSLLCFSLSVSLSFMPVSMSLSSTSVSALRVLSLFFSVCLSVLLSYSSSLLLTPYLSLFTVSVSLCFYLYTSLTFSPSHFLSFSLRNLVSPSLSVSLSLSLCFSQSISLCLGLSLFLSSAIVILSVTPFCSSVSLFLSSCS